MSGDSIFTERTAFINDRLLSLGAFRQADVPPGFSSQGWLAVSAAEKSRVVDSDGVPTPAYTLKRIGGTAITIITSGDKKS